MENLKEYFLKFIPKDKTFKQRIAPASRYKGIKTALESALTEPYIAFCAFTTQDFEAFLVPFQNNQPMIHIPRDTNHKSLKYIDIGVKAKTLFHETLFNDDEKHLKVCSECLQFYVNVQFTYKIICLLTLV